MRCKGCNSEFDDYIRRIKVDEKVIEVPEDLCLTCRGISHKSLRDEPVEDDNFIQYFDNLYYESLEE